MVVAFQSNVLRFVQELHRCELGDALTYYPSVAYEALGLVHIHLFIEDPRARWEALPYAVRASWLVRGPAGVRVLYLHCLVPRAHVEQLSQLLKELRAPHGDRITSITSSDGWQLLDQEQP